MMNQPACKPLATSETDTTIGDPDISEYGKHRCINSTEDSRAQAKYITRIVCSPMTRAIHQSVQ